VHFHQAHFLFANKKIETSSRLFHVENQLWISLLVEEKRPISTTAT
jgi:hypothetical protein